MGSRIGQQLICTCNNFGERKLKKIRTHEIPVVFLHKYFIQI